MSISRELDAFFVRPARQGPMRPSDLWRRRLGETLLPVVFCLPPLAAFAYAHRLDGSLPWHGGASILKLDAMPEFLPSASAVLLALGWVFVIPAAMFALGFAATALLRRRGREFAVGGALFLALLGLFPFVVTFERFRGSVALTAAVVDRSFQDYRYAADVLRRHDLKDEMALLDARLRDVLSARRP